MARFNRIWAGPYTECKPQAVEAKADADILPGTFIIHTTTGFANANADSRGGVLVAQENYLIGRTVDQATAAGDTAIGLTRLPEQLFNVRVPAGQNITNGSPIAIDANGKAVVAAADSFVVAVAQESYNNTTSEDQLVQVRPVVGYVA